MTKPIWWCQQNAVDMRKTILLMKLQIIRYFTSLQSVFDSWSWHLIQTGIFNAFQLREENNQSSAQQWANVKADRQPGDFECLPAQRTVLISNIYFQPLLYPLILFHCKIILLFLSKLVFLYLHSFLVQITYQFQRARSSGWYLLKIKTHALEGRVFTGEAPPQCRLC